MKNKLRLLVVHNHYQQVGGEDTVFAAECDLLRSYGHSVFEYTDSNHRLDTMNRLSAAGNTIWSETSYKAIKKKIQENRPDLVHFHNTFIMISPSAYYACTEAGVPVVQSLHNYRLACPSAIFFRDGQTCEDCLGMHVPWPGVVHKCYQNSRLQTLVVASMLAYHNSRGTWDKQVSSFIMATNFSRDKMVAAGLPKEKIFVKPNFSYVHDKVDHTPAGRDYVFMSGRLSFDKGIDTVINAWRGIPDVTLKITGEGPLKEKTIDFSREHPAVEYYGFLTRKETLGLLQNSRFIVFPTLMYEVFPMVIVEAFSYGIPVVASRLGAMEELIRDGHTGLLFTPGDGADLAEKVRWLWNHPREVERMRQEAFLEYTKRYTPEANYQLLMGIYSNTLASGA